MGLPETLTAERRRRRAAEAEVQQLRAQLRALQAAAPPAPSLAQVVSQLKQTERRLEDEQDFVRLVIDSSPNLVYVQDEQGRLVLANARYARLLEQQAVLVSVAELPLPSEPDDLEGSQELEECYRLASGQVRCFATTRLPLLRADGSRYQLTFSSDITDLKRAHQLAEESVRSKQTFLANMSHEIRTPLHGVLGLVDLLQKEPLTSEQADYADLIRSSTEGLLVVINDTLDFAKLESGSIRLESIPFDIERTVREAARILAFRTEEKGLALHYEGFGGPLPFVKGDPFRLHQVIVNLISNAIKFTPQGSITLRRKLDGVADEVHYHLVQAIVNLISNAIKFTPQGSITLRLLVPAPQGSTQPITFQVADTGIGISADNQARVFDSFQQGDSHVARLYGGTGLGLHICKNLVELQGGTIRVDSAPGQGSCFSFTIPYELSDAPLTPEPPAGLPPGLLSGLRVLLVEDNSINQLIAVSMLGQWELRVEMAQNGEEALLKAAQTPYDLILMDIQMPQVDGFEATARLRATAGPNQTTPIVALTADAVRLNSDTSRQAGFTDYLIKPYSEDALYRFLVRISQQPLAPAPTRQYDLRQLGRLADNPAFVRQLLELFVARVPGQVRALREALQAQAWAAAGREAHALKTTFGTLNIQPEAGYLQQLEALLQANTPVAVDHAFVQALEAGTTQFIELFTKDLIKLPVVVVPNYQIFA